MNLQIVIFLGSGEICDLLGLLFDRQFMCIYRFILISVLFRSYEMKKVIILYINFNFFYIYNFFGWQDFVLDYYFFKSKGFREFKVCYFKKEEKESKVKYL